MAVSRSYHGRFVVVAATVAAGFAWWRRHRPFRVEVSGQSMSPTLEPGDYVIATAPRRIARGDLVVVEHPRRPAFEVVKRVGHVPGDEVAGRVLRRDEFWIEGDRANASTDSRHLGPIDRNAIKGKVRFRYWPPSRFGRTR